MRRSLEALSLATIAFLWCFTLGALYGHNPLAERIATHFGLDGRPDGWGSPAGLYLLPVAGVVAYVVMTVVARFPGSFNYPVRVTRDNRGRLEAVAVQMIAFIKTEVLCLFALIQVVTIDSARQEHAGRGLAVVPVFVVAIFVTIGWFFAAIFRAGRRV